MASRYIIFMDARSLSLCLLNIARALGYDLGGFNTIMNLATPMANNNFEGMVRIAEVPNSINDSAGFLQYARGILGNNYGGAAIDADVAEFFGPPQSRDRKKTIFRIGDLKTR